MDRSTLMCCIALFGLFLGGFLLTNWDFGRLIHAACVMGLFYTGFGLLGNLLSGLLTIFGEHKADRTTHFCPRCGEELFPSLGLWSKCSGWKCENCGAWGDDTTSTIPLSRFCRQATRQAVILEVEELRRVWRDKTTADRRRSL